MAAINYQLRPSKAVQRHMIVDVCRRLTAMGPVGGLPVRRIRCPGVR
ncbi:O-methyltransferase [Streptomyces sp. MAI_2237]